MDLPTASNKKPSALENFSKIMKMARGCKLAIFLDYDGTLTPIVSRPKNAVLSESMLQILCQMASKYSIAIISGRDVQDIKSRIGIEGIFYSGSHGFDIEGPSGLKKEISDAKKFLPLLRSIKEDLRKIAKKFPGSEIEEKKFSIAIHYRNVGEPIKENFKTCVQTILQNYNGLKLKKGKEVFDLSPNLDWHKGKAVLWLQSHVFTNHFLIYIGDDLTDEDAFEMLGHQGIGIVVGQPADTKASYMLKDTNEVQSFLQKILEIDHG